MEPARATMLELHSNFTASDTRVTGDGTQPSHHVQHETAGAARLLGNAGAGFGLTPSSDRLVLKMIVGYRVHR